MRCVEAADNCADTCLRVGNEEELCHFILDPKNIDPITKRIKSNYFDVDELKAIGISVYRMTLFSKEELQQAINAIVNNKVVQVFHFLCSKVRTIKRDGKTCYKVCPRPQNARPSHSEVYFANFFMQLPHSECMRYRRKLITSFDAPISIKRFEKRLPYR